MHFCYTPTLEDALGYDMLSAASVCERVDFPSCVTCPSIRAKAELKNKGIIGVTAPLRVAGLGRATGARIFSVCFFQRRRMYFIMSSQPGPFKNTYEINQFIFWI